MKRFTLLCFALMSLATLQANVISGTCGENLTWSYDTNDHSLVISGYGDMYDFDDSPWYTVAGSISSVTLPYGLTRIGREAFYDCSSLNSIEIPNTVKTIGSRAFCACGLTSLVLPNSVEYLDGYEIFCACSYLTSVTLSPSLTNIPEAAFYACNSLRQITIPSTVTEIGPRALQDCYDVYLESSTPATITSNTFKSDVVLHVPCNSVSAYQAAPIWQFLTILGNMSYNFTLNAEEGGSARITTSVCDANTVVIEATANAGYRFKSWSDGNTDNPRAIVLTADKSVTAQFERSTTYYQVNLSGIRYVEGDGVYSGDGSTYCGRVLEGSYLYFAAINNCGTFTGWSDGVAESSRSIRVTQDTTIVANFTGIETYQVSITAGEHGHLSNEIVGTITSCANSFYTEAIADEGYHFVEWSDGYEGSWRNFEIVSDLSIYAIFAKGEAGGKLGDKLYWAYESDKQQITVTGTGEMTNRQWFAESKYGDLSGTKIVIFEEGALSVIGKNFNGLHYLETLSLPASLHTIGESAFEDCRSLSQVNFAANSNLSSIGDWAFYNCHELSALTLPEGVTTIGKAAFYGCSYMQNLALPASVRSISDNAFALCSRLQKIKVAATIPPVIADKTFFEVSLETPVYVPLSSVQAYKADQYWGRMNIIGEETDAGLVESSAMFGGSQKILRDGQLLILRNGKTYTIQGQEVR